MNNLVMSNITQLCSIIISERFAIWVAMRIRNNKPLTEDLDKFQDKVISLCHAQAPITLKWPITERSQKEWTSFIEKEAKRLSSNLIETFVETLK